MGTEMAKLATYPITVTPRGSMEQERNRTARGHRSGRENRTHLGKTEGGVALPEENSHRPLCQGAKIGRV